MEVELYKSEICGSLEVPASKSSMQRACACALLFGGETRLKNPGKSNDDLAALDCIKKLGASVNEEADTLIIKSNGTLDFKGPLHCGESGLAVRMFTPIAALSNQEIKITGAGSLINRPMDFFGNVFPQLGVSIKSDHGKIPFIIKGPLEPKDITIDGSLSSQFLTGLLLAFAKAAKKQVRITVKNLSSIPYIDLTLDIMKVFGYDIRHENYEQFFIVPVTHSLEQLPVIKYQVESDWSSAACLLVAAAISGNISLTGLSLRSSQADKKIIEALHATGCILSISDKIIECGKPFQPLKPFHFNAYHCPDLFPPLVALAAYCNGTSVIEGVGRLKYKESNRAIALQNEFAKMGVEIDLKDDLMIIKGNGKLGGADVDSHEDHRIAMACAIAALGANGVTRIKNAKVVNKSYPDFYLHLKLLGANVSLP